MGYGLRDGVVESAPSWDALVASAGWAGCPVRIFAGRDPVHVDTWGALDADRTWVHCRSVHDGEIRFTVTIARKEPLPLEVDVGGVYDQADAPIRTLAGNVQVSREALGLPTARELEGDLAALRQRVERAVGILEETGPLEPARDFDTGTIFYDKAGGVHYTVVRTTEGEPVLRPATMGEL